MYRILKADKDTYITDKYVDGVRAVSGNVGQAGSLDLFKLYGITTTVSGTTRTPQRELSRLLVHFDLDPLRSLVAAGKVDIADSSFKCQLNLKDVYGGQPTPSNFTVDVFPLSASFVEGAGKDTAYYSDRDRCNFVSSSLESPWAGLGCSTACFSTGSGDYITASVALQSTKSSQRFVAGDEDLLVDVTTIVSSTLKGDLPDAGFRITFSENEENDIYTYFVKRFGSRSAYDESKRPRMIVRFDDALEDDSANMTLDTPSRLFLYNYVNGQAVNMVSASSPVTGSSCILLELKTHVSGVGAYSLTFTGSQHTLGSMPMSGVYSAAVNVPLSDSNVKSYFDVSGSVVFTPVWKSLDGTLSYVTGSKITVRGPDRSSRRFSPGRYTVNVSAPLTEFNASDDVAMRVNIFSDNSPIIKAQRLPIMLPGLVMKNSHFAVRDVTTNEYAIPFDTVYNSTKLSSDSEGMYLTLNTEALNDYRSYVVDIMLTVDGVQQKYLAASPVFRVKRTV